MNYKEIKTLPAVMKVAGITKKDLAEISASFEAIAIAKKLPADKIASYVKHKMAEFIIEMVISVINDGWIPNIVDTLEDKFFNWFWNIEKKNGFSGRGLSLHDVFCVNSYSYVSPCLYLQSREKAAHAAEFFLPQYEAYYLDLE